MIYAKLFHWEQADPLEVTDLLNEFVDHPEYMAYPHSPEEIRVIGAKLLTDPMNLIWTTYSGKDLTGVMILTRIVPRVDALLHFLFLDKNLMGKRKLLNNLLGYCFQDLHFHRLSMEVPEGVRI